MKLKTDYVPAIKIALLTLLIILIGIFQNVFVSGLSLPVVVIIPMLVSVAMHEKELTSLLFGALSGAVLDLASPVHDGVFAFLFALLACAVSLLSHYKFRNTLLGTAILAFGFALISFSTALIFAAFKDNALTWQIFKRAFLPGILLTALLTPVFYYPVRLIETKLR